MYLNFHEAVLKTNCKCKSALIRSLNIKKQKPADSSGEGGREGSRDRDGKGKRWIVKDVERDGERVYRSVRACVRACV